MRREFSVLAEGRKKPETALEKSLTTRVAFLRGTRQGETKDRKLKWMGRRTGDYSQAAFSNYVFCLDRNGLDGKARLLVRKTLSEMYAFHL